ncbi:MAG: hypothetical protein Q9160_005340 [Pyrenula sp. 1 TL-2023]
MEMYMLLRRILESTPMQPSGLLADDIKFMDVLQREWRLPYAIFCDYEIFERMLQCKFKGFPGESKVEKGNYFIMNAKPPYQVIRRQEWGRQVFPGSSIDMSMLLLALRSKSDRCPQPNCCGIGALDVRSKMFVCSTCQLQYFPMMSGSSTEAPGPLSDHVTHLLTPETSRPAPWAPELTIVLDLHDSKSPSSPAHGQQLRRQSENRENVSASRADEIAREIDELRVFRKVHFQATEERHQRSDGKTEEKAGDHADSPENEAFGT